MSEIGPLIGLAVAMAIGLVNFLRHQGRRFDHLYFRIIRQSDLLHLLMNGVMLLMYLPHLPAAIGRAGGLALVLAVGYLVAHAIQACRRPRAAGSTQLILSSDVHHGVMLAVMIHAVGRMPSAAPAGMVMAHATSLARGIDFGLGAAFILDAVATLALVAKPGPLQGMIADIAADTGGAGSVDLRAVAHAARIATIPHIVMDGGMALMLMAG